MCVVFRGLHQSGPGTLRKIPIRKFEKDETGHQPGHLQSPLPPLQAGGYSVDRLGPATNSGNSHSQTLTL